MISMHSWIFKNLLLVYFIALPVSVFSGLALTPIMILLTFPIALMEVPHKRQGYFWDGVSQLFALLFFWSAITLLWTPDTLNASSLWLKDAAIITLGIIAAKCCTKFNHEQRIAMSWVIVWSYVLALILFTSELITDGFIGHHLRLSLMAGSKGQVYHFDYMNRGVTFLVLCYWAFVLSIRNLERESRIMRWLSGIDGMLVQWVIVLLVIAHLSSMAGGLAFVVSTFVCLFCQLTRGHFNRLLMWMTVAVILATPYIVYHIDPFNISDMHVLPPSAEHRIYIWNFVAGKIAEAPGIGWGFHSAPNIPGAHDTIYFGPGDMREMLPSHPHNFSMQILLETGLPGTLMVVALVIAAFSKIRNSKLELPYQSVAVATLLSYLVIDSLAYSMWQEWWVSAGFMAWIMLRSVMDEGHGQVARKRPPVLSPDVNLD